MTLYSQLARPPYAPGKDALYASLGMRLGGIRPGSFMSHKDRFGWLDAFGHDIVASKSHGIGQGMRTILVLPLDGDTSLDQG